MAKIPAYQIVYGDIKKKIREHAYATGAFLPTESDLELKYAVSRTTIRKAVSMLTSEGYLRVTQGKGTEVLNPFVSQKLNKITSITETLKARGLEITTKGMCIDKIYPVEEVGRELNIQNNKQIYRIQRVQYADQKPIAIIVNYLNAEYVPGFERYKDTFVGLYACIESHYEIEFKNATERITAIGSDFVDSGILQVPPGTPLLLTRRTVNIEQGPFEYAVIKLLPDKYEYSVYLEGR